VSAQHLPPERRVWTHLYLEFSLSREERARLDASLRAEGRSLGQLCSEVIARRLEQAGVRLGVESADVARGEQP
jgi:hypothetical protein